MKNSPLKKHICFFLCWLFAVFNMLAPSQAYAVYEGARKVDDYDASAHVINSEVNYLEGNSSCHTSNISPDPFQSNVDVNWEIGNKYCQIYMGTVGAVMVANGVSTKIACGFLVKNAFGKAQTSYEQLMDEDWDLPMLTPATWRKTLVRGKWCNARNLEVGAWSAVLSSSCGVPFPTPIQIANCSLATANQPLAVSDASQCCTAYGVWMGFVAAAFTALLAIYGAAKVAYQNARICGDGWTKWYQNEDGHWILGKGDYVRCLDQTFLGINADGVDCSAYGINNKSPVITNKFYREFIYGGKEYVDYNSPKNPWSKAERRKYLGYDNDEMRFYMTGPGAAPVFACQRFLKKAHDAESLDAFKYCNERSQDVVCIESLERGTPGVAGEEYTHKFCQVGGNCTVGPIVFEAYTSKVRPNYNCAKTYSVCPYNHLLGGGTEVQEPEENNTAYMKNFCQFMKHCSKVPIKPYIRTINLDGAFISAACKDMVGDSQNIYSYESGVLPVRARGFTAPLAQCFKETFENVLLNTAGDTRCLNPDETPDEAGVCQSGYIYQKGKDTGDKAFLVKIQEKLRSVIKMALVLSVVFFGVMILFAVPSEAIERKKLVPYILKIAVVLYFATGFEWQGVFLRGILGTSTYLSQLVFDADAVPDGVDPDTRQPKVDELGSPVDNSSLRDGCQFPRFNYADSTDMVNKSYPPGQEYLMIWDTLDCKIMRALGFGPSVSVPNILLMIVAGFFTGGLGILFVVISFMFAFFLISLTVRALHMFLLSVVAIVLMIYVSPIVFTCYLFERTKNIFESWKKQLIGFILQPMIVFCYLGLVIVIFDNTMIGSDVRFSGDGISGMKNIICDSKAEQTSVYCIFRISDIKTWRGLELFGIGIPMLDSMTATKFNAIIKAAAIMFIFANLMDKITYFAKKLVGGAGLEGSWGSSTMAMAGRAYGLARSVQKRGMRAIKKHVPNAAGYARSKLSGSSYKDIMSVSKPRDRGADHTAGSASDDNNARHVGGAESGGNHGVAGGGEGGVVVGGNDNGGNHNAGN